jgi:hypothetical protein
MEKERDLGFFNGIKAELIPLIIGLVSFPLVVDTSLNHLESLFFIDDKFGIILFIAIYFIAPVVMILGWITLMNYRDGLKKELLKTKESSLFLLVVVILIGFLLLMAGVFLLNVRYFLLVGGIQFALLLVYLRLIGIVAKRKNYMYDREYRQAGIQVCIVTILLCVFWGFYFSASIFKGEFKKDWMLPDVNLYKLIEQGANSREKYNKTSKSADQLLSSLNDFTLLPKRSIPLLDSLKLSWSEVVESHHQQFHIILDNKNHHSFLVDSAFTQVSKTQKINLDSARYVINRLQAQALQKYKSAWAPWLRVIQFKGLLLFYLLLQFLLIIWYHSYKNQLTANDPSEYSEIGISKVCIYILFLLIVPFFKPIKEDTITFGKPYVGSESSIGSIINKRYEVEPKPCICPASEEIDYDAINKNLVDTLKNQILIIDKLGNDLEQIKKYPKKEKPK